MLFRVLRVLRGCPFFGSVVVVLGRSLLERPLCPPELCAYDEFGISAQRSGGHRGTGEQVAPRRKESAEKPGRGRRSLLSSSPRPPFSAVEHDARSRFASEGRLAMLLRVANPRHKPVARAAREAFRKLLAVAGRLNFQPHRIAHLLDSKGRHELKLPVAFPFALSLFAFRHGAITRHLTWHERLELLVPLDGPLRESMGDLVVDLEPGDVLVIDPLKPHQVVDIPGLDTRAVVVTFMPECVFAPGAPPTDYAFLLPFFRKVEGRPQVLRADSPRAGEAHEAIGHLLDCYFERPGLDREAGCKAWLLVLLHVLIREFRDSALERIELLRRREQAARLQPLFDRVRAHYANPIPLRDAAAMCGMSKAVFGRQFKEAAGMTLGQYLNHVRMAHAVELLEGTRDTITQIAFRLGFSDQSHFDRRFRQTFGCTPTQHRTVCQARR